jgi:hypothetical protein
MRITLILFNLKTKLIKYNMTILIELTTAGADLGPFFDLYSDADNYTNPFETSVLKSALVSGYTTSLAPVGTTSVRIKSTGVCTNYIDRYVNGGTTTTIAPTTTTTSTILAEVNAIGFPNHNETLLDIAITISNNLGSPITECGVLYSTLPDPTFENSTKILYNNQVGEQTQRFIRPVVGQSYYFKAFVTNSAGTNYAYYPYLI